MCFLITSAMAIFAKQHLTLFIFDLIFFSVFQAVCASFGFTNQNFDGIQVGVPFTVTWEDADGPVALALLYQNISSSL